MLSVGLSPILMERGVGILVPLALVVVVLYCASLVSSLFTMVGAE